ncbi:MAG: hypothetical protein U0599_09490 [Vicinamibacteria bacterium]
MPLDQDRVMFLRGLLAAFASGHQVVTYDAIRRLCRLSDEQVGAYLDAARAGRGTNEPDFCSIVVRTAGTPGAGWGDLSDWAAEVQRTHRYWSDRRRCDNTEFKQAYADLPSVPALRTERQSHPSTTPVTADELWARLMGLVGEEFTTTTGLPFTYEIAGNTLRPSRANQNIGRHDFEKALRIVPIDNPGVISDLVRGSAYVWALLHDHRVRGRDW